MTTIYLVRHGQAEGNLFCRIHGHYNSPLTALGLEQVAALRRRFEALPVDAVYSSDLCRAVQTAAAAAEPHGLTVRLREDLREVAMGAWEDRPWGNVREEEPEQYRLYTVSPDRWHVPGCEGWEALQARLLAALTDIALAHPGGAAAVFSHGRAIRALLCALLGVPAGEVSRIPNFTNTSVTLLRFENGVFTPEYGNDFSHLPPRLATVRQAVPLNGEAPPRRDLRLTPFDVLRETESYLRRYKEAWVLSHGSEKGFSTVYHDWAVMRAMADPRTVMQASLEGEPAGMIELAPDSGAEEGRGHIAFLCMDPAFRGRGLAVQLIGHAVSYYRALGREALRLRVNERNARAVQVYTRYGFVPVKREKGVVGHVLIMEKGITLP